MLIVKAMGAQKWKGKCQVLIRFQNPWGAAFCLISVYINEIYWPYNFVTVEYKSASVYLLLTLFVSLLSLWTTFIFSTISCFLSLVTLGKRNRFYQFIFQNCIHFLFKQIIEKENRNSKREMWSKIIFFLLLSKIIMNFSRLIYN